MAITKVINSRNLENSVEYASTGEPHHTNNVIKHRVIDSIGVNAPTNPDDFIKLGHRVLNNSKNMNKNSVQCIQKIISFDPNKIHYAIRSDRLKALSIAFLATKKQFPTGLSLILEQADNQNHVVHCHCLTISRDPISGRSLTPIASFKNSSKFTDKALKAYGYQPSTKITGSKYINNSKVAHLNAKGKYSFLIDLRTRINVALNHSNNLAEYAENLHKSFVNVRMFKGSKKNMQITGNRILFDKPNKYSIKVGKYYLHLRPHFTYDFKDIHGKKHVVRHKKLGTETDRPTILKILKRPVNDPKRIKLHKVLNNTTESVATPKAKQLDAGYDEVFEGLFNTTKKPNNTVKHQHTPKAVPHKLTMTAFKPTYETKNINSVVATRSSIHFLSNNHPIPRPIIKKYPKQFRLAHFHPKTNTARVALNGLINQLRNIGSFSKQKRLAEQGRLSQEIDSKTQQSIQISFQNKANYQKTKMDNRDNYRKYNLDVREYHAYARKIRREREEMQYH